MLSKRSIEAAKKRTKYLQPSHAMHQHDDCIRIAHEWLAAQTKTKEPVKIARPLKHLIEDWGGRYVSEQDVEVAAELHKLRGTYPAFNISRRLVLPSDSRLAVNVETPPTGRRELTASYIKENYSARELF